MPIYQYKCTECEHQLEALQKMSDAKLVDCPECKSPSLRKQLTAAAFKLNGTGWYETDFKNSGSKPVDKTSSDSKKSTDTASDKTSKVSESKSKSSDTASK